MNPVSNKSIKYGHSLLISYLMVGLFACTSHVDEQENKLVSAELSDSVASLATNQRQAKDSVLVNDLECIRGQAEPIAKKKYFPATTFLLQPDSLTAVETVKFVNGDKLIITNWGCEYYVLTFRFETSRFKAKSSNIKYWYIAAGKLIDEMIPGIDAPLDIRKGVRALNNYTVKNARHLKLRTEIDYGDAEIRDFVTLDSISAMQHNRFAVTISFMKGPL